MCVFLSLLCVLCAARVQGIFDGTCLRKDPPPGVLVVAPGSKLVLTCRGHVMVNGLTVNVARNSSKASGRGSPSVAPTTTGSNVSKHPVGSTAHTVDRSDSGVSAVTRETRRPRHTDTGPTASPTTQAVHPTSVSGLPRSPSDWVHVEKNSEADYEDEEDEDQEGEEGNRVTRGIKSRPLWKWNGKMVGKGNRDWGEISFERRGAMLSLSSVRTTDAGNYTCHHRGTERFSLKVVVAEHPKSPTLTCYKKSPSSKIRCESEIQKPTTKPLDSSLVVRKKTSETLHLMPCSYSSRLSRYWCTLDYDEDEMRVRHMVYLCVTGIAGNATSSLLMFNPLKILKPDPPSHVRVNPIERRTTHLRVTWGFPKSWKSQDNYYKLINEIKYKPLKPSFAYDQIISSRTMSVEITDVMPGVEYQVQVRTKDEYDGQWSDWTTAVSGHSWTEPINVYTTPELTTVEEEGSTYMSEVPAAEPPVEKVSHVALWISGCFLLLSVILAVYIFRQRQKFMLKLHHLSSKNKQSDSPQPPPTGPAASEVQALVIFVPPRYKEPPPSNTDEAEEEIEEEQRVEDRLEATHFNNTSYFLLQTEFNV